MRIFITGGSGTIGRRLVLDRLSRRHSIIAVTRSRSRFMDAMLPEVAEYADSLEVIEANPMVPGPWQKKVDGCDAVINLAGAGVLDRRWTDSYKQLLRESRIDTTYQIVRAIEMARSRPGILLNASAIGFYGDRADRELDESDQIGEGFLADLCNQWESQASRAEPLTRVVCMRFGMILDREGGALPRMPCGRPHVADLSSQPGRPVLAAACRWSYDGACRWWWRARRAQRHGEAAVEGP